MNATLKARLRARERSVHVGGHTYTVRRPKVAEIIDGIGGLDLIRRFTVDWNLIGADLVPGGDADPVPFDADLFADYVDDNPALWQPLAETIVSLYREHAERIEDAEKNS